MQICIKKLYKSNNFLKRLEKISSLFFYKMIFLQKIHGKKFYELFYTFYKRKKSKMNINDKL